MNQIRFAAIPKCASRTLSALGILGEVYGRCHTKVTEYPDYEIYQWHYIDRDNQEWYRSWWLEAKQAADSFSKALGMTFENFETDLLCFNNFESIGDYKHESGFNEWIPENKEEFKAGLREFVSQGLGFKEYCYSVIMDGIDCIPVHINDLDSWLSANGFKPVHKNVRQYHDFGVINEGGI